MAVAGLDGHNDLRVIFQRLAVEGGYQVTVFYLGK